MPVNACIPAMTVDFIDEHDPYVNAMGVTAAVANTNFHATGKRLRSLPIPLINTLLTSHCTE